MTEYAELHAHSSFSFLDGVSSPEEMVREAARLGLSGIAITDHNGLYAAVRTASAARDYGIPAIFGAELHLPVIRHGKPVMEPQAGTPDPQATHLLLLARGVSGYHKLSQAIGAGHMAGGEKGRPIYSLEALGAAAQGEFLALTGCRKGPVLRELVSPDGTVTDAGMKRADRVLQQLVSLFGAANVAVEITDYASAYDSDIHDALAELAATYSLPLVATTNAHYARPQEGDLADALAAVRSRAALDDIDGWLPATMTRHLRSAEDMAQRHWRFPEAVKNTVYLAQECAFDLRLTAPSLPPFKSPDGYDEASWLRHLTYQGAERRYGPRHAERVPGAWAQIERELDVIEKLKFPGYFLIVHSIVAFCERQGILCQGRGSAANSAVCYALGITAVDAVRHGLLFERFLAPERDGPPDIDIDIESDRREEVIQHVFGEYGRYQAAMVANVIQYRARSAIRDASRALGYGPGQQDAWANSLDRHSSAWAKSVYTEVSDMPGAAGIAAAELHADPRAKPPERRSQKVPVPPSSQSASAQAVTTETIPDAVLAIADRMMRLPRHLGIHPGGMVLCDRPVAEVCPVEWGRMKGRTVLQWDKDDCAEAGLVKFDLLGLGMLSALRYAFEHIQRLRGTKIGLHDLPQEDPAVYDLLCAADTVGVFQVESRAQQATLPRLRPRKFYDIVIEVAIIRPGPIQGGSVHPYINRARGREPVTYLHPLLEKSLGKTFGVPLFQEQLMQMAMDCAGFDGMLADQLRRAMGSKRSPERMEALRARFMVGAHERGIAADVAGQIFERLKAFADFGFPESHAFSFAYLVYASAWLKVNEPAAFYAGLLAAQPMGFYSPQSLAADARRHGQVMLRPSVLYSQVRSSVERSEQGFSEPAETRADYRSRVRVDSRLAVRLGLADIKGVGDAVAQAIIQARQEKPFENTLDLAHRVRVKRSSFSFTGLTTREWEALSAAGALADLGMTRREGLWAAKLLSGEAEDVLPGVTPALAAPTLPNMSREELTLADIETVGVSVERYPLALLREGLERSGVLTVEQVQRITEKKRVMVAGMVTHRQRPATAKGVTFLSLEDETGIINVVCSPGLWKRLDNRLRRSPAVIVRGQVEHADGAMNLVAEHLSAISSIGAVKSRDFR